MPVIPLIVDVIFPERDIADGQIKEIIGMRRVLKAVHGDVRFLVELLCDTPGEGIQLHAVELRAGHGLRQHPKEISDAAGRLQYVARFEVHAAHGVVNRPYDLGAGVVRVQYRTPRRFVFLRRQQLLQFRVFTGPFRVAGIESLCQTAPTDIL